MGGRQIFRGLDADEPRNNEPLRQLKRIRRGAPISAAFLNQAVDAINRGVGGVKGPTQGLADPVGASDVYYVALETKGSGDDKVTVAKVENPDGDFDEGASAEVDKMAGEVIRKGDYLRRVKTTDGTFVYVSEAGWRLQTDPTVLNPGSGDTSETTTWEYEQAKDAERGVQFDIMTRLYYDSTAGKLYAFTRELTFDASGNIIGVGGEARETVFTTVECPT